MAKISASYDVMQLRKGLDQFIETTKDKNGQLVCNSKFGIYAFYDYDDQPIYVGQTTEKLRTRIRRHLTNQRTDAVAMNVLDPFEVRYVEVWPFLDLEAKKADDPAVKRLLNAAEYTVFSKLLKASRFKAVLNEKDMTPLPVIDLPESYKGEIVPKDLMALRNHLDVRIARRAQTIARLAQVVSEREVSIGLRRTLLTQAIRLEHLARERFEAFGGEASVERRSAGSDDEA